MDQKAAAELLQRYREGRCSKAEEALVHRWYASEAEKGPMAADPANPLTEETLLWQRVQAAISQERRPAQVSRLRRWLPYVAARVLLAFAGMCIRWHDKSGTREVATTVAADVAPGGNRATLTLANGRAIDLSADRAGIVVGADNISYQDSHSTIAMLDEGM